MKRKQFGKNPLNNQSQHREILKEVQTVLINLTILLILSWPMVPFHELQEFESYNSCCTFKKCLVTCRI